MRKASLTMMCSLLVLGACSDGQDPSRGLTADLQVLPPDKPNPPPRPQFHEGSPPIEPDLDAGAAADEGDASEDDLPPVVHNYTSVNNNVIPGQGNKALSLNVTPNARTVAMWLEDDSGYWVVPINVPSTEAPPDLQVDAQLQFSRSSPLGPRRLWSAAADAQGAYGPAKALNLNFVDQIQAQLTKLDIPDGDMVVSLQWNQNMDLDLIVVEPDGSTLSAAGFFDGEGRRIDQAANPDVERVDIDSNQGCLIDGVRVENAIWPVSPKAGTYKVYVRAAETCGFPQSPWTVRVFRHTQLTGTVTGQSYAFQVDVPRNGGPHGPGNFVTDLEISP